MPRTRAKIFALRRAVQFKTQISRIESKKFLHFGRGLLLTLLHLGSESIFRSWVLLIFVVTRGGGELQGFHHHKKKIQQTAIYSQLEILLLE